MNNDHHNQDNPGNELCSGGKILETKVLGSLENLEKSAQSQEKNHKEIAELLTRIRLELKEYTTRDLERIEALEESKKCKSKKIREAEQETQKLKESFATHLGEHKADRRLTVASGVGGAGGLVGAWEFIKYLFTTHP